MQILSLLPSVSHSKTNDVMITTDYPKNELPQSIKKGAGTNDVIIYIVMEEPTHKTETIYP
ncbi:hypothetical protein BH18THE2_BH18THE2_06510 [soil metagenome]